MWPPRWCGRRNAAGPASATLWPAEPVTLREIVETLERVSGVPAPRLRFPILMLGFAYMSKFVGRVTGAPVLVTPEAIRTLQEAYDMSSAKAERELGVTFRPLEETLRDEIAWFRQRQVH
jgi:dihydroflavonol-4-reductase